MSLVATWRRALARVRASLAEKLIPNAGRVLRNAWSLRWIGVSTVLSGVVVVLPYLEGVLPVAPGVFAFLIIASNAAAFAARFWAQPNVSGGTDAGR